MKRFISKLAPAIDAYLEFRTAIGRSTSCCIRHLELFDCYYHEHYPESESLNQEAVLGWMTHEAAKKNNSLSYKASSIRQFAKYMGNGSYVLPIDFSPKKSSFTPYIFTDKELTSLFKAAENLTLKEKCDPFLLEVIPVLLRLLYTCGLRPTEGRLLKRINICFETGEILIVGTKAHKERIVMMSDDMLTLCKQFDAQRTISVSSSEYFFVHSDGSPLQGCELRDFLRLCWTKANPETPQKILPNIRPYDLRHRFASAILQKWLDEGQNLYAMLPYLRSYMGHQDFSSTSYYIHILPENLLSSPRVDWDKMDAIMPEVEVWQ